MLGLGFMANKKQGAMLTHRALLFPNFLYVLCCFNLDYFFGLDSGGTIPFAR